MIPVSVSERIQFKTTPVLNRNFCKIERIPGAAILAGNYGTIDQFNQLTIPFNNVGTAVIFPSQIKDYLYVDIEIVGGIAGIYAYAPNAVLGYVAGIEGVVAGSYVCRIPYCGELEKLHFQLDSYVVKSITVVYPTVYNVESQDLDQVTLVDEEDWEVDGETFYRIVPAGDSLFVQFEGILSERYVAKVDIEVTSIVGLPITAPGYTIFDGVSDFSNFTFAPTKLVFSSQTAIDRTSLSFTNPTDDDYVVRITPKVINYLPISTVYGTIDADVEVDDGEGEGGGDGGGEEEEVRFGAGADNFADATVIDVTEEFRDRISEYTYNKNFTVEATEGGNVEYFAQCYRTAWWKFYVPPEEFVYIDVDTALSFGSTPPPGDQFVITALDTNIGVWRNSFLTIDPQPEIDNLQEADQSKQSYNEDINESEGLYFTRLNDLRCRGHNGGKWYYIQVGQTTDGPAMAYVLRMSIRVNRYTGTIPTDGVDPTTV